MLYKLEGARMIINFSRYDDGLVGLYIQLIRGGTDILRLKTHLILHSTQHSKI